MLLGKNVVKHRYYSTYYLASLVLVSYASSSFLPQKTWSQIMAHSWWKFSAVCSLVALGVMPFVHAYFWLVVRSLRRRMAMEIAVDFDPSKHHVTHAELTIWDWLYGGRGGNGRPMPPPPRAPLNEHGVSRF